MSKWLKKWTLELVALIAIVIVCLSIFGGEWKAILASCVGVAAVHFIGYPFIKNIEVKEIDKLS